MPVIADTSDVRTNSSRPGSRRAGTRDSLARQRRKRGAATALPLLPGLLFAGPLVAQTMFPCPGANWECMRDDLRNLRGMNYVPEYPQLSGSANYYGVASPTAMWHFYHQHAQNGTRIDEQLTWLKRCGFNTVRVFLSTPAWAHYTLNPVSGQNQFLVNFGDFVQRCYNQQIYVIPVLWSDTAVNT